jgi:hypothetical protein
MADAQLCQRIVCGAVSQAEAGMPALYECSQAGYAGALPCTHPDCRPYLAELRAKGVCGGGGLDVAEVLPLHPETQPDDGEWPGPPVPVNLPAGEPAWAGRMGAYCRLMNWVALNQWMAAAAVVAGWWFLSKNGRR